MKQILRVFALLVSVLIFYFQTVNACSLSIPPLRKEFRNAEAVFVGKVVEISGKYSPTREEEKNIPKYWKMLDSKNLNIGYTKVVFEIKQTWKGKFAAKHEFLGVSEAMMCGCPGDFPRFKEGLEYLVFATGKNFVSICDAQNTGDWTENKIKRLDSFWFRAWARIYPF